MAATPPASPTRNSPIRQHHHLPRIFCDPNAVLTLRHDQGVNAVAFSPDVRRLATASADKTARIWVLSGDE